MAIPFSPICVVCSSQAKGWIDAITHPANIDSHVAYLRSAWEGAVLFRVGETEKAQEMSNRLIREVAQRMSQV